MRVAIIPARGGSKRIPKKNIKPFHGKPIIQWSIDVAKSTQIFDRIIVSTDDPDIAEVASKLGAEVPFIRPSSLADDYSTSTAVIQHGVQWLMEQGQEVSDVCCIYATAPFIVSHDIQKGHEILSSNTWEYVFPAVEFPSSIFRGFQRNPDSSLEMVFPNHYSTRSQDLHKVFHDAGQFYWANAKTWISKASVFSNKSYFMEIPRWRVQDIDTPEDWDIAEKMFSMLMQSEEYKTLKFDEKKC